MKATALLRLALSIALILGLVSGFAVSTARAQSGDFPNRPIRMLVGFGAGGGTDIVARIVAQKMAEDLGQSVVVENRTGASGLIAAEDVAKSPPDGTMLMMGSQTTLAVAPMLYHKTVMLDPLKQFAGVTLTGASPLALVANPSFAARSVADVIAMAKANPGKINFGTGGVGTTPHMTAELFQHDAGIKMVHVAYRGEAPAINDTVAGQISLMFANLSAVIGHIKGGTLRPLAVTSAQRSPNAPDVPTVAETLPGFAAETWFGIVAPAGTPHDILMKLNGAARKALESSDTKQRLAELGMSNGSSTPEEFDAYIKSEIAKWSRVIKDANIQPAD
jgi:tripartite-type tricarboxylate transporter receptor subunit TctC